MSFASGTVAYSPGDLRGTLYAYDSDGLVQVRLLLHSSDSTLRLDSLVDQPNLFELNHSINFRIPAKLATGTELRVVGLAEDFVGLAAADTVVFVVQDSVGAARSAHLTARRKPL